MLFANVTKVSRFGRSEKKHNKDNVITNMTVYQLTLCYVYQPDELSPQPPTHPTPPHTHYTSVTTVLFVDRIERYLLFPKLLNNTKKNL